MNQVFFVRLNGLLLHVRYIVYQELFYQFLDWYDIITEVEYVICSHCRNFI